MNWLRRCWRRRRRRKLPLSTAGLKSSLRSLLAKASPLVWHRRKSAKLKRRRMRQIDHRSKDQNLSIPKPFSELKTDEERLRYCHPKSDKAKKAKRTTSNIANT